MTRRFARYAALPALVALATLAGCGTSSSSGSSQSTAAAAIVNGHKLPLSTYQALLNFQKKRSQGAPGATTQVLSQQTMNQMIADELVREYASGHQISVSQNEVNKQINLAKKQLGGNSAYEKKLSQFGLTDLLYTQLVQSSLLEQKVASKVAPVSVKLQPVAQVRHILIGVTIQGKKLRTDAAAKARAQMVFQQLQHGASFAALARKYSDDPGSATQGGSLGTVYPHQMVPEFDHASFTLPLHHPAIVHTMYGYHIIEVLSRGSQPPSAQQQQQQQQQAFNLWLMQHMKTAKIKRLVKSA